MDDTTLLREARRRIGRAYVAVPRQCCEHCLQNTGYYIDEILKVMDAIADHADGRNQTRIARSQPA